MLAAANGGYGFAEGTFADTHGNEQDAPKAELAFADMLVTMSIRIVFSQTENGSPAALGVST